MTREHRRVFGRRALLGGIGAAGTLAVVGNPPPAAAEDGLDYDGPAAFDVAERAYFAQGFTDNESGGYAWGASYYLLGLLRMYQAYRDVDYLERFVRHARTILASTDAARGVTDYAGRSGFVWRSAGNYTAAHGTVTAADRKPAVQIRWAGINGAATTGSISAVSGDRFTLRLANPATRTITLTDVSLDPGDPRYLVRMINAAYAPSARWTAVELRPEPAATPVAESPVEFTSQYYVFAVHTGMISYPLAKYAQIVLGTPGLSRSHHRGRALWMLAVAQRAVAFHDDEFRLEPGGAGDYVWDEGAPIPFDGTVQPYNQSHALGQTLAELHRITKTPAYADKVRALLTSFRRGLTSAADGSVSWPYWAVNSQMYKGFKAADNVSEYTPYQPAARQVEDISHAAISMEFVHAAADAGITPAPELLPHFTATYLHKVVRSPDQVWMRVNGTGTATLAYAAQCARWAAYAEQDAEIYQQALRVYEALAFAPDQGSHALGIAYLNWARLQGWS